MTIKQKKKILLIEDDIFIRDLYVRILEQDKFSVVTADDGEMGLQKVEEETFDLILLDIMLPKLNGIEFLRRIKTNQKLKKIPIFLVTNLGQESIIKEAFNLGAIGYFLKAQSLPQDISNHLKQFFATGEISSSVLQANGK